MEPTGSRRISMPDARGIQRKLHQTIKRVSDDFQGRWHFNTCIAAIMELVNELYAVEAVWSRATRPRKPFQSRCCVRSSGHRSAARSLRPVPRPRTLGNVRRKGKSPARSMAEVRSALAKEDEIEIPVQINGKLRSRIVVPADASKKLSVPARNPTKKLPR